MLHVAAVHWFWDMLCPLPPHDERNVLLLQTDILELAPSLCTWQPSPPNIILRYMGSKPLTEL